MNDAKAKNFIKIQAQNEKELEALKQEVENNPEKIEELSEYLADRILVLVEKISGENAERMKEKSDMASDYFDLIMQGDDVDVNQKKQAFYEMLAIFQEVKNEFDLERLTKKHSLEEKARHFAIELYGLEKDVRRTYNKEILSYKKKSLDELKEIKQELEATIQNLEEDWENNAPKDILDLYKKIQSYLYLEKAENLKNFYIDQYKIKLKSVKRFIKELSKKESKNKEDENKEKYDFNLAEWFDEVKKSKTDPELKLIDLEQILKNLKKESYGEEGGELYREVLDEIDKVKKEIEEKKTGKEKKEKNKEDFNLAKWFNEVKDLPNTQEKLSQLEQIQKNFEYENQTDDYYLEMELIQEIHKTEQAIKKEKEEQSEYFRLKNLFEQIKNNPDYQSKINELEDFLETLKKLDGKTEANEKANFDFKNALGDLINEVEAHIKSEQNNFFLEIQKMPDGEDKLKKLEELLVEIVQKNKKEDELESNIRQAIDELKSNLSQKTRKTFKTTKKSVGNKEKYDFNLAEWFDEVKNSETDPELKLIDLEQILKNLKKESYGEEGEELYREVLDEIDKVKKEIEKRKPGKEKEGFNLTEWFNEVKTLPDTQEKLSQLEQIQKNLKKENQSEENYALQGQLLTEIDKVQEAVKKENESSVRVLRGVEEALRSLGDKDVSLRYLTNFIKLKERNPDLSVEEIDKQIKFAEAKAIKENDDLMAELNAVLSFLSDTKGGEELEKNKEKFLAIIAEQVGLPKEDLELIYQAQLEEIDKEARDLFNQSKTLKRKILEIAGRAVAYTGAGALIGFATGGVGLAAGLGAGSLGALKVLDVFRRKNKEDEKIKEQVKAVKEKIAKNEEVREKFLNKFIAEIATRKQMKIDDTAERIAEWSEIKEAPEDLEEYKKEYAQFYNKDGKIKKGIFKEGKKSNKPENNNLKITTEKEIAYIDQEIELAESELAKLSEEELAEDREKSAQNENYKSLEDILANLRERRRKLTEKTLQTYFENNDNYNRHQKREMVRAVSGMQEIDSKNVIAEQIEINKKPSWFRKSVAKLDKLFGNRFLGGGETALEKAGTSAVFTISGYIAREVPVIRNIMMAYAGMKGGDALANILTADKRARYAILRKIRAGEINTSATEEEAKQVEEAVKIARAQLLDPNFKKNNPTEYAELRMALDNYEQSSIARAQKLEKFLDQRSIQMDKTISEREEKENERKNIKVIAQILGAGLAATFGPDLVKAVNDYFRHKDPVPGPDPDQTPPEPTPPEPSPEPTPVPVPPTKDLDMLTIQKREGVEHVFIKQLVKDPNKFGYKGDLSDTEKIKKWAGKMAHRIAIDNGYVEKGGKHHEVWMKASAIKKAAYMLEKDSKGNIEVREYFKKPDGTFKFIEVHKNGQVFEPDDQSNKLESHEYEHDQYKKPEKENSDADGAKLNKAIEQIRQKVADREALQKALSKQGITDVADGGVVTDDFEQITVDIEDASDPDINQKLDKFIDTWKDHYQNPGNGFEFVQEIRGLDIDNKLRLQEMFLGDGRVNSSYARSISDNIVKDMSNKFDIAVEAGGDHFTITYNKKNKWGISRLLFGDDFEVIFYRKSRTFQVEGILDESRTRHKLSDLPRILEKINNLIG